MNGEDVPFEADRVHPNKLGLWRLARNLLSAQGLEIEGFKSIDEVAEEVGLTAWRAASVRLSNLLSAEFLIVRNESLDLNAKLAKVRGWLAKNEHRKGVNPYVVARARQFIEDKPREAELRAEEETAWGCSSASRKSACAATSAAVPAVQQRYTPVPGGFEIKNGASEFMRPLYGWHGDDDIRQPKRSMPSTSDRPKVALKVFSGMRLDKKARGVLSFGDGTEDVTFRYVWGRAEYDLKGKGTVKMVRNASSDGLLVEVTGDLPPTFDGEWALAAKTEKDGRTYYDFVRKALPRPAGPDIAAAFVAATDRVERIARTIEIKTPDPVLDSQLPCQLVAADAIFEGRAITSGATNWRVPYAGWRVGYVCLSTNPNIAWVDAAKVVVEYADGTSQTLSLLPPDNCDDWLNYSTGQWVYYVQARDNKPYAVKGNPVLFGETAHANVHAITLDPSKELKSLRLVCCGKETIAGILAVTLYRDGCNK